MHKDAYTTAPELDRLTVRQLHVLEVLLEARSVTVAAGRLGVGQPAASHALRALRGALGDPLLVPGRGGMVRTARAEALFGPLQRLRRELYAALGPEVGFNPGTTSRRFVVATWDGLTVQLLPALLARLRSEAPGVDLDVIPVPREGSVAALEAGLIDLSLEVAPREAPGIKRRVFMSDELVCVVRRDHPLVGDSLDLDLFCALPHALISPQGEGVSVVDRALAAIGRSRRVMLRIRYFLAAPLVVAESDLILTAPRRLAERFVELAPLRCVAPPVTLSGFTVAMVWHERVDRDAGHRWLRDAIASLTPPPRLGRHG